MCCALEENLSIFCSCPETLWEIEIKDGEFINVAEEISRQPKSEAVTWILLVAFYQVYTKSQKQKAH